MFIIFCACFRPRLKSIFKVPVMFPFPCFPHGMVLTEYVANPLIQTKIIKKCTQATDSEVSKPTFSK